MKSFASTASIAASPDRIWSILADVARWPEWSPTVTSVEPLDSPALKIGARYRILQPKLRPAVWSATEVIPARNFTWESRSPGLAMVAEHIITSVSAGESRIDLRFSFSGFLAPPVAILMGKLTRSYLEQEAMSLKRKSESLQSV